MADLRRTQEAESRVFWARERLLEDWLQRNYRSRSGPVEVFDGRCVERRRLEGRVRQQ